jgi:hypothetical protein
MRPGAIAEAVTQQVHDAGLVIRGRPHRLDRVRQTGQAVADDHAHIGDTAVLDLGEYVKPVLGAFTAVVGPQPEDVTVTFTGDGERQVDGSDETAMGIGDDELNAGQAASDQAAQERQPAGAVFGGGHLDSEDLPMPIGVHAGGGQDVDVDGPPALAPPPITNPDQIAQLSLRRHQRLGGTLHEYQPAA